MSVTKSHALVIIDPQNDFCDHRGSLYVDGAAADIARLASHVEKSVEGQGKYGKYSDIFISLDSHDAIAIFHPRFWIGDDGKNPAPFTPITDEDLASGKWRAASPPYQENARKTFAAMKSKNIASVTIWPEHCIVSTWGHQIADRLREALRAWREATGRAVRYVFKGENPYTDQFSIFEGLDSSWPETAFNEPLFEGLSDFDAVTFAGEALSHCVEASILSYTERLGDAWQKGQEAQKEQKTYKTQKKQNLFLLADCSSPVAGFERQSSLDRISKAGVTCITTE
jgi:nicotinamidase-related amidase